MKAARKHGVDVHESSWQELRQIPKKKASSSKK
jgi:hypothetical protein